jgi:hypothetical protein
MSEYNSTEIGTIFRRAITRDINKVVKVEQKDERVVAQELEEYILTAGLERNFTRLLEAFIDSERGSTDEVGIWISGFFGSGKSHFMKILGYLLEDRSLGDGSSAADIFSRRTEDETLKGAVRSIGSKFDSEVLMFQIGSKENKAQAESISEIIYREFNKKHGYAGTPWVAEIEKNLEQQELYDEFKSIIERETGTPWEQRRTQGVFVRKDLVNALVDINSDFTEEDARRAVVDVKEDLVITAEKLTTEILAYTHNKGTEQGDSRYCVFLDEISQFIGEDSGKLLELQSIVEEFGRQGDGKLWLGVTSQEKLEELVPGVLANPEEESKVGDRFDHRADLTSEELDKVIRERILQKKEDVVPTLSEFYSTHSGQLSKDYKLESTRRIGSVNKKEFIECYPFVPYQLEILPNIFAALRGRGSDDKLTGRERTLIDVTHSVFNEPHNLKDDTIGSLVTLDVIFDEIAEEISDEDRTTIEEVSLPSGKAKLARQVLKALYLLQQLDWIPTNKENIATVLYPQVGDTRTIDDDVKEVLDILLDTSYIGRSDEGYRFLSQTERGIEDEIASIDVRAGDIRRNSKKTLRNLFENATTVGYKNDTFDVSVEADGETVSETGEITVEAYSPVYGLHESVNEKALKTQSFSEDATIYWIATENGEDLLDDIERLIQVTQVVGEKERKQISPEEKDAVQQKKKDLSRLEDDIQKAFRNAFRDGVLIYNGDEINPEGSSKRLETILESVTVNAIPRVYTKYEPELAGISDDDVKRAFGSLNSSSLPGVFRELSLVVDGDINPEASLCQEIADEIDDRLRRGKGTSGKDLRDVFEAAPYGWNRNAVRLGIAMLFRNSAVVANYKEKVYASYTDSQAQSLFTGIRKFNSTTFEKQEGVDPPDRRAARDILDKLFDKKVQDTVPEVADGIEEACKMWRQRTRKLVQKGRDCCFQLTGDLTELKTYLDSIAGKQTDARKIKGFLKHQEYLEDLTRTAKDIYEFDEAGNLDEYARYRRFLDNEWGELLELNEDSQFVGVSDRNKKAAEQLEVTLQSEQVIENWPEARTDYGKIAQTYAHQYESLFEKRYEVYQTAIKEVEEYAEGLDEDEIDEATKELQELQGSSAISIDISEHEHLNRQPTIDHIEEYIRTVDSYIDSAKSTVDRIREEKDETRRVTIDTGSTLSGTVVREESDIEPALKALHERIKTELDDEDDVEIRFK